MNKWVGVMLVTTDNKIILQQRDNKPQIENAGMVAFFGGGIKPGESTIEAVIRELREETELTFTESDLELFGEYQKRPPIDNIVCDCYVFVARGIDINKITVHEGEGYIIYTPGDKLPKNITRITKQAISDFTKS